MAITKLVITGNTTAVGISSTPITVAVVNPASTVTVNPNDNITATNVQDALEQLDDIKAQASNGTLSNPTFTGQVGIGTTSPDYPLDVAGSAQLSGGDLILRSDVTDADTQSIRFENSSDDTRSAYIRADYATNSSGNATSLVFGTNPSAFDGSNRMVITDTGNVGIGTDIPERTLHIKDAIAGIRLEDSDGTSYGEIIYNEGSNGLLIRSDENAADSGSNIIFEVDGSESARIDASGRVGIGTSNPAQALHVVGKIRLESNFPTIEFVDTDNNPDFTISGGNGSVGFFDETNSVHRLVVNSSGNVGIGTTSPQAPLHVHGDINLGNSAGADAADVEIASLNFYNRDTSGSAPNNASIIRAYSHSSTGSGGYLTFATSFGGESEGADATEKMRIDASGNVGIGTASPDVKLDVTEAYDTVDNILSNGNFAAKFSSSGSGDTGRTQGILLSGQNGNSRGVALLAEAKNTGNAHDFIIATSSSSSTPTERMRIDASGNVGIGTTSPDSILDVVGADPILTIRDTSTSGSDSHATLRLAESGASDSLNLHYDISLDEGHLTFNYDNTGSNATERLRIDSSGHVIIPAGITLGTTTGTYAAANTLDDYEEGTWTPNLYGTTTGSTSPLSYGSASTQYTKVGRLIYFSAYITNVQAANHSKTGEFRISGLPFVASRHAPVTISYTDAFTFDEADISVSGYVSNGSTYISIRKGSSKGAVFATELTNNNLSDFMISGSYTTT